MSSLVDPGANPSVLLPLVEDVSDGTRSSHSSDSPNTLPRPLRALVPVGKTPDGKPLFSIQSFDISDPSSLNSSTSTLFGDGPIYELKSDAPLHKETPLPPKKGSQIYRWLRWSFGSVYRRIFTLAYIPNIIVLLVLAINSEIGRGSLTYSTALTAVSANILASLIVRNEHTVNALFLIFGTWPKRAPLSIRRLFAKVYSYGGIHSGCGVSATCWYLAYLVLVTKSFSGAHMSVIRGYVLLTSYLIIFCLITILVFAYPRMRVLLHNSFEVTHRFLGWSIVILFWFQTILICHDTAGHRHTPTAMAVVMSPPFWMLILITLLVIYPWTHLRLRDVEAEALSSHVVKLNFDYATVHYGQAVRITDRPLRETHAFAVIPKVEAPACPDTTGKPIRKKGFSILVSNAGDWTSKTIAKPPKKIWTRGVPQYGVLRIAGLFNPVLVIATGSGIGPCLSLFVQRPDHPVRIIWSARDPEKTYGREVLDIIYHADERAIIWDTRSEGRPDLVAMAGKVWGEGREGVWGEKMTGGRGKGKGRCEAVVVISNHKVTEKVVYGLESRGIAAYGAIFDS